MDKPPKYNTVVLREDPPEYMVSQNIGKLMRIRVSGESGESGSPGVRGSKESEYPGSPGYNLRVR